MTDLAQLLNAKRAAVESIPEDVQQDIATELTGPEAAEMTGTVTVHGEIVPAPPAPVEYAPQYPSIPPKVVGGLPYVRDYMKLARTIHSTEMVPTAFKGRPDAILATFLRGYELGFGPMQALDSFSVIEGKVGLSAEAMRALIMDNGHQFILEDVISDSNMGIQVKCHRKDWPADVWATYGFTMEDARVAGLLAPSRSGKPTAWQKYPRAMLDARATSGAARRYFADVLAGMSYTPEEIRDFGNEEEPSQANPPQPAVTPVPPDQTITSGDQPVTEGPVDSVPPEVLPLSQPSSASSSEPPPKATRVKKEPASVDTPCMTGDPSSAPSTQSTTGSDVKLEMRKALTAIIASLKPLEQPLVRAFLAQQGYGDISKLDPEKIQEAIDIAAGWPDTAVVDAEIVPTTQELADEFEQQAF